MMRTPGLLLVAALGLLACSGETSSNAKAPKKVDGKAWESTQATFNAPGWKAGDREAWELQMRTRAQQQNEYAKSR